MKNKTLVTWLSLAIALLSGIAASIGIFSDGGPGPSTYMSVRGTEISLYGKGVYHHMSAEVAPQGIAQDVVTLFIAIPLLLISLVFYNRNSFRAKIILTGITGYFLVSYLFFTMMAMYNQLYLLWVTLLSICFFTFIILFQSLREEEFNQDTIFRFPAKLLGGFLIFNSISIALLWLSVVVPPAINGTIPKEAEHYTTLVVQALDLSILLPASLLAGIKVWNKNTFGYKLSSIYIVFLSILMTALSAKVAAMALLGYNVIPVIIIIPIFNLASILLAIMSLKSIQNKTIFR